MFAEIFRKAYEDAKQEREAEVMLAACSKFDALLEEAMDLERRRVAAFESIARSLDRQTREGATTTTKHGVGPYTGRHLREDGTVQ